MPSTFTFPLQFCLTLPYLSQKHLGKQEGKQSFSWAGSPCTTLFLLQSPSSSPAPTGTGGALASARTDHKWGVQPAALRVEMQFGVSRSPTEREIWEWQAQVPATTSTVWPSLSQSKRSLNRKALAGCPRLGGRDSQTQLGWAGPFPLAWLASPTEPVGFSSNSKSPWSPCK